MHSWNPNINNDGWLSVGVVFPLISFNLSIKLFGLFFFFFFFFEWVYPPKYFDYIFPLLVGWFTLLFFLLLYMFMLIMLTRNHHLLIYFFCIYFFFQFSANLVCRTLGLFSLYKIPCTWRWVIWSSNMADPRVIWWTEFPSVGKNYLPWLTSWQD